MVMAHETTKSESGAAVTWKSRDMGLAVDVTGEKKEGETDSGLKVFWEQLVCVEQGLTDSSCLDEDPSECRKRRGAMVRRLIEIAGNNSFKVTNIGRDAVLYVESPIESIMGGLEVLINILDSEAGFGALEIQAGGYNAEIKRVFSFK